MRKVLFCNEGYQGYLKLYNMKQYNLGALTALAKICSTKISIIYRFKIYFIPNWELIIFFFLVWQNLLNSCYKQNMNILYLKIVRMQSRLSLYCLKNFTSMTSCSKDNNNAYKGTEIFHVEKMFLIKK